VAGCGQTFAERHRAAGLRADQLSWPRRIGATDTLVMPPISRMRSCPRWMGSRRRWGSSRST